METISATPLAAVAPADARPAGLASENDRPGGPAFDEALDKALDKDAALKEADAEKSLPAELLQAGVPAPASDALLDPAQLLDVAQVPGTAPVTEGALAVDAAAAPQAAATGLALAAATQMSPARDATTMPLRQPLSGHPGTARTNEPRLAPVPETPAASADGVARGLRQPPGLERADERPLPLIDRNTQQAAPEPLLAAFAAERLASAEATSQPVDTAAPLDTLSSAAPLAAATQMSPARDATTMPLRQPLSGHPGTARANEPHLAPVPETPAASADGVARDLRQPPGLERADERPLPLIDRNTEHAAPEPLLAAFAAERLASAEATSQPVDTAAPLDTLSSAALMSKWTPAHSPRADSAHAPATAYVDTPLGADGWSQAFQQKIVWLVDRNQQSAELHVNPPHLGPVEVVLNLSDDGARIAFCSPHAAVREAIEASMSDLRTALGERGLTLGEALVSADPGSARQQFQDEGAANARRRGGAALPPGGVPLLARIASRGLVDTFA